jgi:hypothetical protein
MLFVESHNRIRRAQAHAGTFTNAYIKFLHDKPYGLAHEKRDDRNGVIKLVPRKFLEWDLPLVLGEYFYQLRAALDGAMWQAYLLCGGAQGSPKIRERDVYFPICETPDSLKNAAFQKLPLPNDLGVWLNSIQPCNRSKSTNEITDNLLMINRRSTADRHRQMHLVGTVVRSDTPLITLTPPAALTYVKSVAADPLKGEYVICEFGFEGMTSETEINVDGKFAIQIKVEEIPDDLEIMVRLFNLIGTAQKVIGKFDTAFG